MCTLQKFLLNITEYIISPKNNFEKTKFEKKTLKFEDKNYFYNLKK